MLTVGDLEEGDLIGTRDILGLVVVRRPVDKTKPNCFNSYYDSVLVVLSSDGIILTNKYANYEELSHLEYHVKRP